MSLSKRKLLLTAPSSEQGAFLRLEYRYMRAGFFCERKTQVFDRVLRSHDWVIPCGVLLQVLIGFSQSYRWFSFSVATLRSARPCFDLLNQSLTCFRSSNALFLAVWKGCCSTSTFPLELTFERGLLLVPLGQLALRLKICSVSIRGALRLGEPRISCNFCLSYWMYSSISPSSDGMKSRKARRSAAFRAWWLLAEGLARESMSSR